MYSKKVLEHFVSPQNMGELEKPSGVGEVGNPTCGDMMRLYIDVEDNVIKDIKFKTYGCGAAIASTSALTVIVKGKTIEEALKLDKKDVVEFLGELPAQKVHCSVLAIDALKEAIENWKENQEK
ncbi:MAG: iron-sulfur cluster assembly scaffold protein [Candidatus Zixiibacteriota bacterium]